MRIAFKMSVHPKRVDEYVDRHNPIWPELESVLKEHGVKTYSIFLDKDTNSLFAYAEVEDRAEWERIAETDVCRRWWEYMAPLMQTNEDLSPRALELDEVFHVSN